MHLVEAPFEKRSDEIAHRFRPEAFGQRRGTNDVAEQHRDQFEFARKHASGAGGSGGRGSGYIRLGRVVTLLPGAAERRAALTAEPMLGGIAGAARRTGVA